MIKNDSEVVFIPCPSSNNLKPNIKEEIAEIERKLKEMRQEKS
jgi:hypothetical protein